MPPGTAIPAKEQRAKDAMRASARSATERGAWAQQRSTPGAAAGGLGVSPRYEPEGGSAAPEAHSSASRRRAPIKSRARRPQAAELETSSRACGRSRSEEHTSELQSLMRISYAVFCLKKKTKKRNHSYTKQNNQHR